FEKIYVLSEKGQDFIKKNKPWLTYHQFWKYEISKSEFIKTELENAWGFTPPGNDIIWAIMNKRALNAEIENRFTDLRTAKMAMFDVVSSENKHNYAVKFATEICALDLAGLDNFTLINPSYS